MRFRRRHVHQTIVDYLTGVLDSAGWIGTPVNFGTTAVTVLTHQPLEAGETPAINSVAITMGDEMEVEDSELGGPQQREYTLFVDVYGANEAIADSIAADVQDALDCRVIPVRDYTSTSQGAVTEEQIEFESVLVQRVESAATTVDKRTWRVVKASPVVYF